MKDYSKYGYIAGFFLGIALLLKLCVLFADWDPIFLPISWGIMGLGGLIFFWALIKQSKEFKNEWISD